VNHVFETKPMTEFFEIIFFWKNLSCLKIHDFWKNNRFLKIIKFWKNSRDSNMNEHSHFFNNRRQFLFSTITG
jgi:hypothetical protein